MNYVTQNEPVPPFAATVCDCGEKMPSFSVKTFGDLLRHIETWTDLPVAARYRLTSAIRRCIAITCRNRGIERQPADAIPCDVFWLNQHLFTRPPRAHNLAKKTFRSYIAKLRFALRRVGVLNDSPAMRPPSGSQWEGLLVALRSGGRPASGLTRFASWCHVHDIAPTNVTAEILAAYEHDMTTFMLHINVKAHIRHLAKLWRRLGRAGTVCASARLVTPRRRAPYTLKFDAYPAAVLLEVEGFQRYLGRSVSYGPFQTEGLRKSMRDATIRARLFSLRQALAALVQNGRNPSTIMGLAELVEEKAFEEILLYFWRRAIDIRVARGQREPEDNPPPEAGISSQTNAIATTLKLVARYLKLDPIALGRLGVLAKAVRPVQQTEISPKLRALLNELSVPATRKRLLDLPKTLMKLAENENLREDRPLEAGRLAMIAAAIEFELSIPLRIKNLTELRLDRHLQRIEPGSNRISLLSIPLNEMKNDVTYEWPINADTAEFLERYIRDFRPLLLEGEESPWLFPAGDGNPGRSRSILAIRAGITNAIAEHVGVRMHVHAFRAFLGMLILEAAPGNFEDLRLLLGHKTCLTAQKYYAYLKPSHAARRVGAILRQARSSAPFPGRHS